MTDDEKEMTGRECVEWLFRAYLHMTTWGTPDREHLDRADREEFEDMARAGDLWYVVERLKVLAVGKGKKLPKEVLLTATEEVFSDPLTPAMRARSQALASVLLDRLSVRRGRPRSPATEAALRLADDLAAAGRSPAEINEAVKKTGRIYAPGSIPRMRRHNRNRPPRT